MKINLQSVNYYFLTCNNPRRKKHILNEFKNFNLVEVNPLMNIGKNKSGISGFSKILDLASQNQIRNKPFQHFVIFEDDVKKYREFPSDIEIPNDTDILYIGLSTFGFTNRTFGVNNAICYKHINKDIIKVYNMLATHGMIICSIRGLLAFQKCLLEDYFTNRAWDTSIANMQPYLNVYALKMPLVYQFGELGGEETYTKFSINGNEDKEIPKEWINKRNISILTNFNSTIPTSPIP